MKEIPIRKSKRWQTAQKIEKNFWAEYRKRHKANHNKVIQKQISRHITNMKKFIPAGKNKRVLEIGCGPIPIILALRSCKKYALDPLMDYYVSQFKLPKGIRWIKGVGESMPFEDGYFDAIICVNVLDHVKNPEKVLSEIYRTTKKDGTLYLTMHCSDPLIKLYKRTREKLGLGDKAHPFTFTANDIRILIEKNNFKICNKTKQLSYYGEKTEKQEKKRLASMINETIIKILAALNGKTLEEAEYMSYTFIAKKV